LDCQAWTIKVGNNAPLDIFPDSAVEYLSDIARGAAAHIPADSPYEAGLPEEKAKELKRAFIRIIIWS
jgi:hypothetical protein